MIVTEAHAGDPQQGLSQLTSRVTQNYWSINKSGMHNNIIPVAEESDVIVFKILQWRWQTQHKKSVGVGRVSGSTHAVYLFQDFGSRSDVHSKLGRLL